MNSSQRAFDELLHENYVRWADTENRLAEVIDAIGDGGPDLQYQVLLLKMLRDDVAKWRREAKEDYEAF